MSDADDWEIPRASDGKRLRRGDSAVLAAPPPPLARRSTAELKTTLLAEAAQVWPAAAKLVGAENWFRANTAAHPKSPTVEKRALTLTAICFRSRLSGGNALLAYAGQVAALADSPPYWAEREWWAARWRDAAAPFDLDPGDPVALWRAVLPCPHALAAVAFQMMGWSPWWDSSFGRDPPPCRFACRWAGGAVRLPCLDAGPRVRLVED